MLINKKVTCRNNKEDALKVLIIGAGRMGAFHNEEHSIISLAHGFSNIDNVIIEGFIDIDIKKAERAVQLWGGKIFTDIEDAFSDSKIDIVYIAVPDEFHYNTAMTVINNDFKLLIIEKPICTDIKDAYALRNKIKKINLPVLVNYNRRFLPEFIKLKSNIENNIYGELIAGSGYYDKGIIHNGSHMVDLIMFLLGRIEDIKVNSFINDYKSDDPSVSFTITINNGKNINVHGLDCRFYTTFELDLFFSMKRIRILDFGQIIEYYEVEYDNVLSGYKSLVKKNHEYTSFKLSGYYSAKYAIDYLTNCDSLADNLNDSIETLQICNNIAAKIQGQNVVVI